MRVSDQFNTCFKRAVPGGGITFSLVLSLCAALLNAPGVNAATTASNGSAPSASPPAAATPASSATPPSSATSPAGNAAQSPGDTKSSITPVNWTYLILWSATKPSPFQGSDDRYNLVYDLVMTNFSSASGTLKQLDILDANSKKLIQSLSGKALEDLMVKKGVPGLQFAPCECAAAFINLSFDSKADVPTQIAHRVVFETATQDNEAKTFEYKSDIAVEKVEPVVISPPLKGDRWVALGGYSSPLGHRRALLPINNHLYAAQTYAIDWFQVDNENSDVSGDRTKVESFICYGKPVLAVVDATVAGVIDRFDDQAPDKAVGSERLSYPTGNTVILDLGHGYYATYAHLKRGSIKVKQGDQVSRGQTIAQIGNSGNTTMPHLHFHVTKGLGPMDAAAIPYVIDNFEVKGEVQDIEKFMLLPVTPKTVKVNPSKYDGKHVLQLPREALVVKFAE